MQILCVGQTASEGTYIQQQWEALINERSALLDFSCLVSLVEGTVSAECRKMAGVASYRHVVKRTHLTKSTLFLQAKMKIHVYKIPCTFPCSSLLFGAATVRGGGQVLYKKDGVMKYCQFSGFICDEKSQRKDHQKTKHRPYFALAKKLPIQLEKNTNMFCKMMNFPIIFPNQIPCIFFPYTFPVFFSSKFGSCNFCLQDKELTKKNLKMRSTKFLLQGN